MDERPPVSPVNGVPLPEGRRFEPGEEQRERSRRAGKRSGEVRRQRKTMRQELEYLLTEEIHDKNGKAMNTQKALGTSLIKAALNGSVQAFIAIRDTIGEKPVEKVDVQAADFTALEAAYKAMKGE